MKTNKQTKVIGSYGLIFGYLGVFLMFIGVVLITPVLSLIFYSSDYIYIGYFLIPGFSSILLGFLLYWFLARNKTGKLQPQQDMILLVLIWIFAILIGTIPFLCLGKSFTKSVFEMTSGFTTTGFGVFPVNKLPKIFLLYRSITNFFGGIGLVLILASAINLKHGTQLYRSEGHEGFMPSLIKSAKIMLLIYSYFILIGACLYTAFGMSVFDAINHSISSIATGGFSTKMDSIASFSGNLAFEVITLLLMIIGATNFLIYIAIYNMQIKKVFKNAETIYSLITLALFYPLLMIILMYKYKMGAVDAFRYQGFTLISAQTTAGLQSIYNSVFDTMPNILFFIVCIKMMIGGHAGSTSGGIKKYRIIYIFKGFRIYVASFFKKPRTIRTDYIWYMGKKIQFSKDEYKKHLSFVALYSLTIFIGTLLILIAKPYKDTVVEITKGVNIKVALFNFISALGNVGLSFNTMKDSSSLELWIYTIGMFIGRLEIMPVFMGSRRFFKDLFKKKKKKVVYNEID